jgi:hypothetical protein
MGWMFSLFLTGGTLTRADIPIVEMQSASATDRRTNNKLLATRLFHSRSCSLPVRLSDHHNLISVLTRPFRQFRNPNHSTLLS